MQPLTQSSQSLTINDMNRLLTAFAIIVTALTAQSRDLIPAQQVDEYVDFLYSRMPVADSIDHPRDYWRDNVRTALVARASMPWGEQLPEREFRHFVLPVRVNNEDLDSSRMVFYRILAPRVSGMNMADAALEVNHWCHEQATYAPSDSRTSSPLATVRTTLGRCGEESTFTVAALRSVGIPARQVYTPRWAHTDDNHAWVEVWIDGQWHFLGACEPEPLLDMAWFNAPASRGMLMGTNVFGRYDGPEQQLYTDSCITRINVTSNYAPVRQAGVKVLNADGTPAVGAEVSFRLYNYAEYYPLFTTTADNSGRASLQCGRGDLVVWASDSSGRWGMSELPADTDEVTVILDSGASFGPDRAKVMTLTPPAGATVLPEPTAEQSALNDRRKVYEDSVRNARMATFYTADRAREFASTLGPQAQSRMADIEKLLPMSYGNHQAWTDMLAVLPDSLVPRFIDWAATLSVKDLRDVTPEVMADAFTPERIVSPRIANELLTPFNTAFDTLVPATLRDSLQAAPLLIPEWVRTHIADVGERNPNRYCISPAGVYLSRMADPHSRDIFFCAFCRWLGVPAYIDAVTGRVMWSPDGSAPQIIDLEPKAAIADQTSAKGTLHLTYPENDAVLRDPGYYYHFTLSRLDNGVPRLLEYSEDMKLSDISNGLELEAGTYLLTSGRRLADGGVLARTALIDVAPDADITVPLVIVDDPAELSVVGSVNADPLLPYTGRGFFILAVVSPGHEPTAHLLNELKENRKALESWGKKILLVMPDSDAAARLTDDMTSGLPDNVVVMPQPDPAMLPALAEQFDFVPDITSLPAVIVGDSFNRVVFHSEGYRPGLGSRLVEITGRLKE